MRIKNEKVGARKRYRYSFAFKKEVIEIIENGKMSQNQA